MRAHVRRVCALYEQRQRVLAEGLAAHFARVFSVERPAGGMQLIARLRRDMDDAAMVRALAARGVQARALSSFYLDKAEDRGLLLGFAGYAREAIEAIACRRSRAFSTRDPIHLIA